MGHWGRLRVVLCAYRVSLQTKYTVKEQGPRHWNNRKWRHTQRGWFSRASACQKLCYKGVINITVAHKRSPKFPIYATFFANAQEHLLCWTRLRQIDFWRDITALQQEVTSFFSHSNLGFLGVNNTNIVHLTVLRLP